MCLRIANVTSTYAPNWDGDRIVGSTIIEASRYVPGTKQRYSIDIRQYLLTHGNAVVRRAVEEAVDLLDTPTLRAKFWSGKPGSFDLRVRTVCRYLAEVLNHRKRKRGVDAWMYPDETLAVAGGDCEDHAIALAAMILGSGVSGYVVRVALGKLHNVRTNRSSDHAWVTYKNEAGQWLVLDPLLFTREARANAKRKPKRAPTTEQYEYIPHFVFNNDHLWAIRDRGQTHSLEQYVDERTFWHDFDPSFATSVHNSILDEALVGMSWINRQYVKAVSLAADANIATYDPRDHFDNGYVSEGFARVAERLATGNLNDFGLACHAIADFYSHSSWGVFGERRKGVLQPLLDPKNPKFARVPDYSAGGPFPLEDPSRFSVNEEEWDDSRSAAARAWQGKIISGRYAQANDPHQGAAEKLTYIPSELCELPGYHARTGLPHHGEIAVDDVDKHEGHQLYSDNEYAQAFAERRDAARAHIAAAYKVWRA